ncbi:CHAT domain-containing protein [Nitrosovibrio tenuis]|uniref:CHAT domain-containing protein n=1 Tax=Nitrosovibrio tenuis TaxID=1233 RepID=A0A1H7QM78_9PROT|nr:CHAT domain-containing protein [Nitrosovibrio tenuis]SEL48838.1 CHAT domain-containing protein [Nitrosovibrio tenuis]
MGPEGSLIKLNQALAANPPTYLHLSTHGSFQRLNPLGSGLELARNDRLTVGDLLSKFGMLSGNRLAILSACETGVTSTNAPAEAIGLPAAFMGAGASGVISTLWTVDDRSTTFLINKFYELHRNNNMDPPKALAQAQNWLRTATYQDLICMIHSGNI